MRYGYSQRSVFLRTDFKELLLMLNGKVAFISSGVPEAATEELWSRSAIYLAGQGVSV